VAHEGRQAREASPQWAIRLLSKRPVVVAGKHVLVGFDEQAYAAAFAG